MATVIEQAFASMNLRPGQGVTSANINTMRTALRQVGIHLSEAEEIHLAKKQIQQQMDKMILQEAPVAAAQTRNDRESRSSRSPVSGNSPRRRRRSPFRGRNPGRSRSPAARSRSPMHRMFNRGDGSQYQQMNEAQEEEEFHDARAIPSPARPTAATAPTFDPTADLQPQFGSMNIHAAAPTIDPTANIAPQFGNMNIHAASAPPVDPTASIAPQFGNMNIHATATTIDPTASIAPQFGNMSINQNAQFNMGTAGPPDAKKRASPSKMKGRPKRTTPRTKAATATPGLSNISMFTTSPPTPNSLGGRPPTPPSFYNPTFVGQPQPPAQQTAQPQAQVQQRNTQQPPVQQQNVPVGQRKKVRAKTKKAAAVNPFNSPTPTFPQEAIFGGDAAMQPQRLPPNTAERASAAKAATKLSFSDSPATPADATGLNPPPSEKQTCARTRRCASKTPYTTNNNVGGGNGFAVDLKPEPKKNTARNRAFRRPVHDNHGIPINRTNTADTASITDNSPATSAASGMSFEGFKSPPTVPVPAGTQAYWQAQPFPQAQAPFAASAEPPVFPTAAPAVVQPTNTAQFNIGVASAKPKKFPGRRKQAVVQQQRQANLEQQRVLEDKLTQVMVFRDSAKMLYQNGDYRKCILACSRGIKEYQKQLVGVPNTNLLGVLYSNRAAALLMVGAFQAAADDCSEALKFTSYSSDRNQLVEGSSPSLKAKLLNRRARARGKMGDIDGADEDFDLAMNAVDEFKRKYASTISPDALESLNRESIDATNGKMAVMGCRTAWEKVQALGNNITWLSSEQSLDTMEDVNKALSFCSGNSDLQEMKIKLLAHLKRWRELVRYCERIGAEKVKMDGCFEGDLELKNPFPGVDPAKSLTSQAFDGVSDDDVSGVFFKLEGYKAKAEVALRLPYLARPAYVKGLRLQEDYYGAKECIARLEVFVQLKPALRTCFTWLAAEKKLVEKTESLRGNADELFSRGQFDAAADQYYKVSCLDRNAGGRLNAVMHCNRAACFMAVHKLNEALIECNRALQLHPRYMKALLRRARCHTRLERYDEAIADYQRYLDYVRNARNGDTSFIRVSPMVFDGPSKVSENSVNGAKEGLDEARKLKQNKTADDNRRRAQYAQQQWRSERFNSDAQRRRENFYQSSSRPWDSFANRGPKRSPRSRTSQNQNTRRTDNRGNSNANNAQQNQNQHRRQEQANRSPRNVEGDCYTVLGVSNRATQADIKRAYRKLAIKHHPDKSKDPNAADNFRSIQEAYDNLKDEETRGRYDRNRRRGF